MISEDEWTYCMILLPLYFVVFQSMAQKGGGGLSLQHNTFLPFLGVGCFLHVGDDDDGREDQQIHGPPGAGKAIVNATAPNGVEASTTHSRPFKTCYISCRSFMPFPDSSSQSLKFFSAWILDLPLLLSPCTFKWKTFLIWLLTGFLNVCSAHSQHLFSDFLIHRICWPLSRSSALAWRWSRHSHGNQISRH